MEKKIKGENKGWKGGQRERTQGCSLKGSQEYVARTLEWGHCKWSPKNNEFHVLKFCLHQNEQNPNQWMGV